jgi:hypothetical protein
VRVTGYLNLVRIDLPVLELSAEERYHKQQRRTNPTVDAEGGVREEEEEGVRGDDALLLRCGDEFGRSLWRREAESEDEPTFANG